MMPDFSLTAFAGAFVGYLQTHFLADGLVVLAVIVGAASIPWRRRELQRQTTRAFIDKELAAIAQERERQERRIYQAVQRPRRIVDSHPDHTFNPEEAA